MMDVLRYIGFAFVAVLLVFLAYLWMEIDKEKDKLKELLEEERKKVQSERESRERAERKFSAANRLIEKLKAQTEKLRGQNKDLEARLNKLWEDTARLRKPTGAGPKK
jgi:predicted  nucleic acid-binding Zn-ribbon protein